jgi:hypothetical protein
MGATGVLTPGAALAGTLDQQQTDDAGTGFAVHAGLSVAQTFTAGIGGGLDRIDLDLRQFMGIPAAPLTVQIRDVSAGKPGNTTLASQSVVGSSVPASAAFVPIDFTPPAPVVAGTQYAIVAFSSAVIATGAYAWSASAAENPYAGGAGFDTNSSPPTTPWNAIMLPEQDLAFKTYVVPTPPPAAASPSPTSTGLRAAALAKCKHKHSKKKRKRCRKRAKKLPA